ncbi:hypothetical protein SteCoe_30372 [Stentor coeruleus]|uniref:Ubiquinone biosynthesis protein n=1 Tax=Stentor coeruleus TaxID=5963 RepID=A0A1R2B3S3_9CILI|nr:hypothetical protein SteCoe_30372 [Stentor coeruleus]
MWALRKSLINKSLELVHTEGWDSCMQSASLSLNLSPAIVSQLFPKGQYELIEYLMQMWNEQLYIDFHPYNEITPTNLYTITRKRLEYMNPYLPIWTQAMKIGANPQNIITTTNTLWNTFDSIWKLAGEKNVDTFYPIKRGSLAMIYLTTEVKIVKNPHKVEECWKEMEEKMMKSFDAGKVAENVFETMKFVANANYRILQSFYPEPSSHQNPINKYQ